MPDNTFTYINYSVDDDLKTVKFLYEISQNSEHYQLTETITFPTTLSDDAHLQTSLKALHLALGISYYKIFVSQTIKHSYNMDDTEAEFWNKVFEKGLGEFLYINKLGKSSLAKFSSQTGISPEQNNTWQPNNSAVLGIGGGKDSIVAGELLKQANIPIKGFVLATGEQLGQTKDVANIMQTELLPANRILDKQLLVLQEREDAYKGHVPISLIFGLIGSVIAISNNSSYVVVANESSASIPRIGWQGEQVNHQWSKSFEFETMLQKYIHTYISTELTYFSAIRPLGSVAIAKLFAKMSQYFEVFTSDNSVFRIDKDKRPHGRWSLDSPKSLSSFILLSPWLNETELLRIFGMNFLDEPALEELFLQLMEVEGAEQPLDCVGTTEELRLSLNLTNQQDKFISTALMQKARDKNIITDDNWHNILTQHLKPSPEQAIPSDLYVRLLPLLTDSVELLNDIRGKDVVFVGAGKGRSLEGIEEFLRNKLEFGTFQAVDKQDTANPLVFLQNYDKDRTIFIKNEGIPGQEMPVPYITPMQLFLSEVAKTGAKLVGITGTKGKSTTASLTSHILETAGKHTILAGNIGTSALASLLKQDITPATIFVLELSSYQLSDFQPKLDIAACINLYNDHADWHGTTAKYWSDKQNIVRALSPDSYFVYNPDFDQLNEWTKYTQAKLAPIDSSEAFDMTKVKLFGDHNRLNILIAKKITSLLGIDDDTIRNAVNSFRPLDHRMQFVATKKGLTFIDDSIGMTPESTIASIKAVTSKYGEIGCIMLGGQDRGYDFSNLMNLLADLNIPNIVLFPDTVSKMKGSLPPGYHPNLMEASTMAEATRLATDSSPENSVVLLSTAAPSYSLWKDFEDKGNQFQSAVNSLDN